MASTAVFLDFATMGVEQLDPSPLLAVLPDLEFFDQSDLSQVPMRVAEAEYVLTNKIRLDSTLMQQAGKLRFIGLTATGSDNVDLGCAERRGVAVANTRGYCTQSVVEHVFATLLNLNHSIGRYRDDVANGLWQAASTFCLLDHPIRELSSMTLGIVGYGELGRAVATVGENFGMTVMVSRRVGASAEPGDGRVDLDQLLSVADVISLHCPLTDETRNLIGAAQLDLMQADAVLINTARGALVDSAALVEALRQGSIRGAAIDVLSQEPPVDGDPLLDYSQQGGDNLILTPHIAWATETARQNALVDLAENIKAFQAGARRNRLV